MVEPVETMDGWYVLHRFWRVDWVRWEKTSESEKKATLEELTQIVSEWEAVEKKKQGSQAIYQIIGQKADIMFMILRPTLDELLAAEKQLNKAKIAEYLLPTYAYFSIVELAKYRPEKDGVDPERLPEVQARLKPILPRWKYLSFYPMSRRRIGAENWYTLSKQDRGKLLYEHSITGRKYAGKVQQIVTGSVGLEKFEWGVTLFAHDALDLKKIVYEMRFDEVSAKYGEFDEFYIGSYLNPEDLTSYFND